MKLKNLDLDLDLDLDFIDFDLLDTAFSLSDTLKRRKFFIKIFDDAFQACLCLL